jgi:Outer membrane protein beta-barrel domain
VSRKARRSKRGVVRIGGLVLLVLVLSAAAASAQVAAGEAPQLRWSVEGAVGVQIDYTGTFQSVAFGFAPTRRVTLLIGAERSRTDDQIEFYADGYASERGGLVEFVSAQLRYAFFANRRVSPYAVVGAGRGVERPNVNEFFPYGIDRHVVVIYYGAGARIPVHRRLDVFTDWRLIVTADDAAEMAVLGPLRAGLAFRF